MEKNFTRSIDSLDAVFAMIDEFAGAQELGPEDLYPLNLAVEEIFTNMVKYSRESDHDILIRLDFTDDALTICMTDFDVEPFDVTKHTGADMDLAAETAAPGGRGLFLVKQMMDDIQYEYKDRTSKITMTKKVTRNRA